MGEGFVKPLWRQIADDLARDIERGAYKPEEALPTAQELSARYGVHRHTVRQAFQFLASQGRVSVEQGRGTFVTSPRIPYPVGRHVSFRTNLAKSGMESRNTVLDATVTAAEFAPAIGLDNNARAWCVRILSEASSMPLSLSTHFLSVARFPDFPQALTNAGGSISAALASYGIAQYQRLSTRLHARAATAIEARLLHIPEGSPVLHSSGLDAAPDGSPLQAVDTAFAGDRIEVVVEPD
ncbi:phosphonate metabolism transcriptional regulator PhnF [Rhizomicrobium palustre]|nr:phosphonate metabolism transcriptional regulator PhnF [Rhizomicrobium palustre]